MMPRVCMDPMSCSPNATNVFLQNGQTMISPNPPQSSSKLPIFYSSPSPTPLTPWIHAVPPPPPPTLPTPYFMLSNHQPAQHFPFQQLI